MSDSRPAPNQARKMRKQDKCNWKTATDTCQIHVAVILKGFDFDPLSLQEDLDPGRAAGHIMHTLLHEGNNIYIQVGHLEFSQIGFECDASPVLIFFAILDLGGAFCLHVVRKNLLSSVRFLISGKFQKELIQPVCIFSPSVLHLQFQR